MTISPIQKARRISIRAIQLHELVLAMSLPPALRRRLNARIDAIARDAITLFDEKEPVNNGAKAISEPMMENRG